VARRAGGGQYEIVPGIRAALVVHYERLAHRWAGRFADSLAAARAGDPMLVAGETVWRALFTPSHPEETDRWLGDGRTYLLEGADALTIADDSATL